MDLTSSPYRTSINIIKVIYSSTIGAWSEAAGQSGKGEPGREPRGKDGTRSVFGFIPNIFISFHIVIVSY